VLRLQRVTFLLTLCAALSAGVAYAGTIVQFDGFATGTFTSGSDNGFTITAVNGFVYGNSYGFPGNSAGVPFPDTTSTYTFSDGGDFTFVSLDIDVSASGQTQLLPPITVAGYSGALLVATDSFPVPSLGGTPETFDAVNLAGLNVNSLVVSVTSNALVSPLIDNVTFNTTVPEPATISTLGVGLCAVLVARRRRNEKAQRP